MGIDMSRPASSNQQICQEGHMLIHMKMDVITREDGQQTLTLRCSLCDSMLRMSEVSKSELICHPVVTAAGQTLQNSQITNQADTNTSERESSFADFSQDFVKTDPDSVCGDLEDDLYLDMHVESYESFQLSNENAVPNSTEKTNEKEITSTVDRGTRRQDIQPRNVESFLKRKIQKSPISVEQIPKKTPKLQASRDTISVSLESSNQLSDNNSNKNCTSSGQPTVSAQISSSERRFKIPTCKFCFATNSEFGQSLVCSHKCPKTGGTIFICSVCNEYYSSCTLLIECERKHRQINGNSSKEEFKCIVCDKTFADFRETRQHETCHIQTDSGLTAGTSLLHEASSISDPGRSKGEDQNRHISHAVTSSMPFTYNSQVPLVPQAVQFSLMHQNSHISHAISSSTVTPLIHHSQVPLVPVLTPQAAQSFPVVLSQHELEKLRLRSHDAKGFCTKLMGTLFSSAERVQTDKNVLGISKGSYKKESLCPIRIQYIKDCVQNMYPTEFQNNPQRMWSACVTAMNTANRNLRSSKKQRQVNW